MRDRSKAAEDKLAQLMESYAAFRTSWDKEVKEKLWTERGQRSVFMKHSTENI